MIYINTSAAADMPDMLNSDNKSFIFNKDLDAQFLNELFDGDMEYAETVFGEFMKNLPDYWKEVEDAYNKQHIRELRTAVHKCKTLFGYVGSADVQAYFQKFEHRCDEVRHVQEMKEEFAVMQQKKDSAHVLIANEYNRLKAFHETNKL